MGDVKEHHDQALPLRPVVGPEQDARQQRRADQSRGLGDDADDEREREGGCDDARQLDLEPAPAKPGQRLRARVKQKLQRKAGDDQRHSHCKRAKQHLGRKGKAPQRRAKRGLCAGGERGLHNPDREREADAVDRAQREVAQGPLVSRVEGGAIDEAEGKSADRERRDRSRLQRRLP